MHGAAHPPKGVVLSPSPPRMFLTRSQPAAGSSTPCAPTPQPISPTSRRQVSTSPGQPCRPLAALTSLGTKPVVIVLTRRGAAPVALWLSMPAAVMGATQDGNCQPGAGGPRSIWVRYCGQRVRLRTAGPASTPRPPRAAEQAASEQAGPTPPPRSALLAELPARRLSVRKEAERLEREAVMRPSAASARRRRPLVPPAGEHRRPSAQAVRSPRDHAPHFRHASGAAEPLAKGLQPNHLGSQPSCCSSATSTMHCERRRRVTRGRCSPASGPGRSLVRSSCPLGADTGSTRDGRWPLPLDLDDAGDLVSQRRLSGHDLQRPCGPAVPRYYAVDSTSTTEQAPACHRPSGSGLGMATAETNPGDSELTDSVDGGSS